MSDKVVDQHLEKTLRRMDELQRRAATTSASHDLLREALAELAASLQELQVIEEELRQQNEALAAAEHAAATERRRYQDLFEFAPNGYVVTDRNGVIQEANRAAAQSLGVRQEYLVGLPLVVFVVKEERANFQSQLLRPPPEGSVWHGETRLQPSQGISFPSALTVAAIRDPQGDVNSLRWLFHDIGERKRMEEQFKEHEHLAAIGVTAATFAHVVGNPVNSLFTTWQLLDRRLAKHTGPLDSGITTTVRNLGETLARLMRLLNDFRSLTRWPTPNPRPTQLATVIEEILTKEAPACAARNIDVERKLPPDLPLVAADREQRTQVLKNLCENAIEALPQGGTLTLQARHIDGRVQLDVHDTGGGAPAGLDIFAPFVTTKTQGTGLGLTIVRQIMSAHGGSVTHASAPGEGTTFTLTLPVALDDA